LFTEGREQARQPNEWIFHESRPGDGAGILLEGGVKIWQISRGKMDAFRGNKPDFF